MNEEQERMLTAWNDPPASPAEEIAEARLWAAEQKHTPGPWDYRKLPSGAYIVFHTYDKPTAGFIYQEPNARLIAAAPDMLEALKGMIQLAEEWFLRGYRPKEDYWRDEDFMIWRLLSYDSNRFQAARAAIAKAEGREA